MSFFLSTKEFGVEFSATVVVPHLFAGLMSSSISIGGTGGGGQGGVRGVGCELGALHRGVAGDAGRSGGRGERCRRDAVQLFDRAGNELGGGGWGGLKCVTEKIESFATLHFTHT